LFYKKTESEDSTMAGPNYNIEGEAKRNLMLFAVDVSAQTGEWSASSAIWEVQGYKTEDTSLELNADVATLTDILGDTYATVNKFDSSITFEPNTFIYYEGVKDGALNKQLLQYFRYREYEKFSNYHVMIVYGFMGSAGSYEADVYTQSTVVPNSIGGAAQVNFPFTATPGGDVIHGTVNKLAKTGMVFTPTA
jgi:hypothetical protein